MSDLKKDIFRRVLFVFSGFCLLAVLIVWKIVSLQFYEGEYWSQRSQELTIKFETTEPVRGSIFSDNGSLLSASVPVFNIYIDFTAEKFKDKKIDSKLDSLSGSLSAMFKDRTPSEYRRILAAGKYRGYEYYLLKRNVSYKQLKAMRQLPVFRHGRYKGGLIAEQKTRREKPFRWLAERTLGFKSNQKDQRSVGLEAAYHDELKGVSGWRVMQKIAGGIYKPLRNEGEVEPKDGRDIISTINVNLQDVAENSLHYHLKLHNAQSGCVVLMEVSTGEIKAIANLTRGNDGNYRESYNIAVGHCTEPGSTFKLPALMAAFEDNKKLPDDSVDTGNGIYYWIPGKPMKDSHEGGYGKISVQRSFEVSSNIGVSKIINQAYAGNPMEFVTRLRNMHVDTRLNLQIQGEGRAFILDTSSNYWGKTALPYMSIGYSVKMTPLQTLTFYNAVANNGKMVKPMFVKEIREQGKTVKIFEPEVISDAICSPATLRMAQQMLEGVVTKGTASDLFKGCQYTVAGKTGTARINQQGAGYEVDGIKKYQASFVGYFPADKPKYSCIVVFYEPGAGQFYASKVAAPVFRELADKIYSTNLELHQELKPDAAIIAGNFPQFKKGRSQPTKVVSNHLNLKITDVISDEWIAVKKDKNEIKTFPLGYTSGMVPDVTGMGLRDALLLLENYGIAVQAAGKGKVISQSLQAGSRISPGSQIQLTLN
ncbi:MAG: transpeptidase family protein [Bacteroidia bacterium]|nr:transpeptidase family protein [Bacteroidia bacterium]